MPGTGAVGLAVATPICAAVSGNDRYNVNGTGSLSFYGPAGPARRPGDWTSYSATVSGAVSITLTTDGLTLNGQRCPPGRTRSPAPRTLAGSGQARRPNFAGSASITVTGGTSTSGRGPEPSVGGKPARIADVDNARRLQRHDPVSANGDGTDAVTFAATRATSSRSRPSP